MIFEKLNEKYVEDAVKIAQAQYNMEQQQIEALYDIQSRYRGCSIFDNERVWYKM